MYNIWKRSLAMLLAFAMVLGYVPVNAFAVEEEYIEEIEVIEEVSEDVYEEVVYEEEVYEEVYEEEVYEEIVEEEVTEEEEISFEAGNADAAGEVAESGEITDAASLKAALKESGEVKLAGDIELTETIVIPEGVTVELDLNGFSISMEESILSTDYAINNQGTLTIKDSSEGQSGSINARGVYNGYGNDGAIVATAKITVESGTINAKGTNGGAAIFNYGVAEINGGNFTSIGGYSLNNQSGASMTIAEGVTADNGIYASGATVIVNGGEIKGNRSGCHVFYAWNSNVTINSGEFYNNNPGNSTLMAAGTTEMIVNGGTFGIKDGRDPNNSNTWTSCLTDTQNTATLTVKGGTFNGGFRVQAGTTMNIEGGSFNDCYGSGYNIYGTAEVKGGTFTDAAAQAFAKNKVAEGFTVKEDGTVAEKSYPAKIGTKGFDSFADALNAAKAMTGDVVVEIYGKVTVTGEMAGLAGSYDSIKFVGKNTDAEIYLDVQGYITATGKKVAFEDLKLSKVAGGYIANAGFMNLAFGMYDVAEVTYTNCTFVNGAYASFGDVTFTDCTFYHSHDRYGLWAYGEVDVTVDGCTFADIRGIKMYDEGKAGIAALTVKNTDFSAVYGKPAIVLTYGESVTLENNTYNSDKGVLELDLDGAPNGVPVSFTDSDENLVCVNDNGACGVLVDGKIYTTVTQAAEAAEVGSTVTLLHNSTEEVELPAGVQLDKNGFTADSVTKGAFKAGTKAELDAAIAAAQEGDVVTLTGDIDYGTTQLRIEKAITLDLGGYTLTTSFAYGGIVLKNGPSIKNGKIVHTATVAAIKAWQVGSLEDLEIEVTGTGNATKVIGGIVLQEGTTTRVDSIKNVTINGAGLTNGIQTDKCGNAAKPVIGSMKDVSIEAVGTGMLISAPCGTATNCDISGGVNGIEIALQGTYSASLTLEGCVVEGGVYAHDEFSSNPDISNVGSLTLTVDEKTTGADVDDVVLTLARAEDNVAGVLGVVVANTVAVADNTYYSSLEEAVKASDTGSTITLRKDTEETVTIPLGVIYNENGFTAENVTVILPAAVIGDTPYATVKEAVSKVEDGETITLMAGTFEEGIIELPATLKNVTIKGAENKTSIIKNSKLASFNGGSGVYEGITIEGIVFDGSQLVFTCNSGTAASYKDWTITGCEFKNITSNANAAVHFNMGTGKTIENFTFTNNVINGVGGGNVSGLRLNNVTGNVVITGNNISNAAWNAIQFINVNASALTIENNTLASGADEGILNLYNVQAEDMSITANKFLATDGQHGIAHLASGDVSGNYWGGKAPTGLNEGVTYTSYYLDEAMTRLYTFGSMASGVVMDEAAKTEDSYIYFDLKDMPAEKNSVVIKLYSGETLLSTTKLVKQEYMSYTALSANVEITKKSSSWETTWTEGHPRSTHVPDKAELYIDGQLHSTTTDIRMYNYDNPALKREWSDIEGVYWVPQGDAQTAYVGETNLWGEWRGNAKKSWIIKFFNGETYMGQTSLNNIDGILDGDVGVTWHMSFDPSNDTDAYWEQTWVVKPSAHKFPNRAEFWIDGVKVGEGVVQFNGPDYINAIVALATEEDGTVTGAYTTVANAVAAGATHIALVRDTTETLVLPAEVKLDTNGHNAGNVSVAVAKVDGTYYDSLETAIKKAKAGETITLLADADLAFTDDPMYNNVYASVIDLNGKTLTIQDGNLRFSTCTIKNGKIVVGAQGDYSGNGVFYMFEDNVLTLDNVKVIAENISGYSVFCMEGSSNLVLENSEVTINGGAFNYGIISAVSSGMNTINNSKITANNMTGRGFQNGNYTIKGDSEITLTGITKDGFFIGAKNTLDIQDTTQVNITLNPDKEGRYGINLAEGAVYNKAATATVNATDNVPKPVAQIGGVEYTSLQAAVDAVENDDTIVLVDDITLAEGVIVEAAQNITLDLNGKTVFMSVAAEGTSALLTNNGTLTIKDSGETGKLAYATSKFSISYSTSTVINNGTLTVESGMIENTSTNEGSGATYAIDNYNTLTVNGGTFESARMAIRQAQFGNYDNTVTINGGNFSGYAGMQTDVHSAAKKTVANINGGTFTGTYAYYTQMRITDGTTTEVKISDGTFNGAVYLYNKNNGSDQTPINVSVTGGTFTGETYIYTKNTAGEMVSLKAISGGTFANDVSDYCAEGFECIKNLDDTYGICEKVVSDDIAFTNSMIAYLTLKNEVYLNVAFNFTDAAELTEEEIQERAGRMGLLIWDGSAPAEADAVYGTSDRILENVQYVQANKRFEVRTAGIPAKNLGDTMSVRAYYESEDGSYIYGRYVQNYSPKKYCYSALNNKTEADKEDDALMVSILNYGATAQKYFAYETDNLMNADLSAEQKTLTYDASMLRSDWSIPADKEGALTRNKSVVTSRGTYLSLLGAIDYNYYIKVSSAVEIASVKMLVWDEATYNSVDELSKENATVYADMQYVAEKSRYEYKYVGLPAKDMFTPVYTCAVVTDTAGNVYYGGVLAYCPERFALVAQTSPTEYEPELGLRLVAYGSAARDYFINK